MNWKQKFDENSNHHICLFYKLLFQARIKSWILSPGRSLISLFVIVGSVCRCHSLLVIIELTFVVNMILISIMIDPPIVDDEELKFRRSFIHVFVVNFAILNIEKLMGDDTVFICRILT